MDLERISAELRPRRSWEAIDLGTSLFRRHMGRLLLFWSVSVLPLIALLTALLWSHLQILAILVWWLKPLFDRVPLLYLSRALFGSELTLREFFKALPRLWTRRLLDALVMGRLSLRRSFVMPIKELEGLKGSEYRSRRGDLDRVSSGETQWLLALCLLLEHFFTLSLILLVSSALPLAAPPEPTEYFRFLYELVFTGKMDLPVWVMIGGFVAWVASMTITEHLYVAGGFGLYLNARTHLEGWDVELSFRRIASRVAKIRSGTVAGGLLGLVLLVSFAAPGPAFAQEVEFETPKESISRILADDDFEIHVNRQQVPVSSGPSWEGDLGFLAFLGGLGPILFWALVAGLVAWAISLIVKNSQYFVPQPGTSSKIRRDPKATTILGMKIGVDSLPSDIVGAAKAAWEEGKAKEALSLLYRGAISWFVDVAETPIEESDTESDCVRRVRSAGDHEREIRYLEELTGQWIGVAYGRSAPEEHAMRGLLDKWPYAGKGGTQAP
ncbi:MAG: hypothetical protein AAGJ79_09405 [Verrucomicrobiota bacterium]